MLYKHALPVSKECELVLHTKAASQFDPHCIRRTQSCTGDILHKALSMISYRLNLAIVTTQFNAS